jgi:hypothetical protein
MSDRLHRLVRGHEFRDHDAPAAAKVTDNKAPVSTLAGKLSPDAARESFANRFPPVYCERTFK